MRGLVPLERWHISALQVQAAQQQEQEMQGDCFAPGWAYLVDGVPLAVCGLTELWPGRAYAWALLGADVGPYMLGLTRAIRAELDRAAFTRVEMAADAGFVQAYRFAELLGFVCETPEPARAFFPNGHDAYLFAKVKR